MIPEVIVMKIDMWLILEGLQKYNPKYDIKDSLPTITGIRFLLGSREMAYEKEYVYLCSDEDTYANEDEEQELVLINGRDIIMVRSRNANDVLNDILAIFDHYNHWEASLWELSASGSMQQVLDLGQEILENPMSIADNEGNVIAMTSVHRDKDINDYWVEMRNTLRIPVEVLGAPKRTEDDKITSWTADPEIYYMPDGTKTIGQNLIADGEPIGAVGLWELDKPISPGHRWLFKTVCDVLVSMSSHGGKDVPIRSEASILADLISGTHIDEDLLERLDIGCAKPWKLVMIFTPYQNDTTYAESLISRMTESRIACVPFHYDRKVLVLVNEKDAGMLIGEILGLGVWNYYYAARSLPFDRLSLSETHYRHLQFVMDRIGGKPGNYDARDYALEYILAEATEKSNTEPLHHPALKILRKYDEENHSEMYRTLYYYLLYERSNQLCADKLHIHRNSFLYRIKRIEELTGIDPDNPEERKYLMASYLLQRDPGI